MRATLIIFDWKWTLYHPPSKRLMPGAYELLEWLASRGANVILIGKDQGGDMDERVDKLEVRGFFNEVIFVSGQKTPELFLERISKYKNKDVWVVGDRVRGEIAVGNRIDAKTVWYKSNKFVNEIPMSDWERPDYEVDSLSQLKEHLS